LKINKVWVLFGIVLLFLIFTNPGAKRFKEFSANEHYSDFRRVSDWIILSVYEDVYTEDKFVGIAFNFFKINGDNSAVADPVARDSVSERIDSTSIIRPSG
jgi:hypothetical protein